MARKGLIALVLRGDHELNEIKASKVPGVSSPFSMASREKITQALNVSPGSIGPIGLRIPVFVDPEAAAIADFVCGANKDGVHYTGANWTRDVALKDNQIIDIRNVVEGDPAPNGEGELRFLRGIEVGHIFQLDSVYSEPMGASVQDADGNSVTTMMGCYGMGVTRLVAAIIEQNHDERGICWPLPVAPFDVHLLALNYDKSKEVQQATDDLYTTLQNAGVSVLFDDRAMRPGGKFADADLLGLPLRVTVGDRGLKNQEVEYKQRRDEESSNLPLSDVLETIMQQLK